MPLQRLQTCPASRIPCLTYQAPPPPTAHLESSTPKSISSCHRILHQPCMHLPCHFQRLSSNVPPADKITLTNRRNVSSGNTFLTRDTSPIASVHFLCRRPLQHPYIYIVCYSMLWQTLLLQGNNNCPKRGKLLHDHPLLSSTKKDLCENWSRPSSSGAEHMCRRRVHNLYSSARPSGSMSASKNGIDPSSSSPSRICSTTSFAYMMTPLAFSQNCSPCALLQKAPLPARNALIEV